MASVIELLAEDFESIAFEAKEREKHGEPFCAKDYQDRFSRLSVLIFETTGMHYEIPALLLLYKGFEART